MTDAATTDFAFSAIFIGSVWLTIAALAHAIHQASGKTVPQPRGADAGDGSAQAAERAQERRDAIELMNAGLPVVAAAAVAVGSGVQSGHRAPVLWAGVGLSVLAALIAYTVALRARRWSSRLLYVVVEVAVAAAIAALALVAAS